VCNCQAAAGAAAVVGANGAPQPFFVLVLFFPETIYVSVCAPRETGKKENSHSCCGGAHLRFLLEGVRMCKDSTKRKKRKR
jgi:hypothetical protein